MEQHHRRRNDLTSRDALPIKNYSCRVSDKGFASKAFERSLFEQGITLLRPSRKKEVIRAGEPMLKKVRQLIESVNDDPVGVS